MANFGQTAAEVKAWISNYIILFSMNVNTYPHPSSDAGLVDLN